MSRHSFTCRNLATWMKDHLLVLPCELVVEMQLHRLREHLGVEILATCPLMSSKVSRTIV